MKKCIFSLLMLGVISLSGCSLFPRTSSSNSNNGSQGTSLISQNSDTIKTIEIYTTNDIHGQVYEESGRSGLGKFATYFKEKREEANTLLLDQGDTWQGSIYSNYNHGALITDVMNYIHYDARSVGNHDFDWGTEYIKSNTARSYNGYSTPVLAGNVYDFNFDTKVTGTTQQSSLGVKSTIVNLDNGLKVGILGGIGSSQITSISSLYVHDIAFTDHIQFIKDEATHLKNDEKCDVIICSIHTEQEEVMNNNLESYIDLVLCGHTHKQEYAKEGNLYYVQNYANTQSFSHITLTYDAAKKDVTKTFIDRITGYKMTTSVSKVDPTIQSLIDSYYEDCNEAANEVLAANVTNGFPRKSYAENVMAKAMCDTAIKEGHNDIVLSLVNDARHDLAMGKWKYEDLYQAFPFDNNIVIAEVTGNELFKEMHYNYICRNPKYTANDFESSQKYKIAVIDYLYYHTDEERYYDYFNYTGGTSNIILSKNYRETLRGWLKDNEYNTGNKALDPGDFSNSVWQFDKSDMLLH